MAVQKQQKRQTPQSKKEKERSKLIKILEISSFLFVILAFILWAINNGLNSTSASASENENTSANTEKNINNYIKENEEEKIVRTSISLQGDYTKDMKPSENTDVDIEIIAEDENGFNLNYTGEVLKTYTNGYLSFIWYQNKIIPSESFFSDYKATLRIGEEVKKGVVRISGKTASITCVFLEGTTETMGYVNLIETSATAETTTTAPTTVAPAPVETEAPTTVAPAPVETETPTTVAPAPVETEAPTVIETETPTTVAPAPVETEVPTTITPATVAETVPPTTVVIQTAPPTVAEEPKMETQTVVVQTERVEEPTTKTTMAEVIKETENPPTASGIQADLGGFGTPMTEPQTTKSIQNIEGFDGNGGNGEELDEKDQEKIDSVLNDLKSLGF